MKRKKRDVLLLIIAVMFIGILTACSANTPAGVEEPAAAATAVPVEEMAVEPSPEPTQEPTAEPKPTQVPTAVPSPTAMPELQVEEFTAWCMPEKFGLLPEVSSSAMPEYGRAAVANNGVLTVLYPDSICTFSFTFNQPAPQGLNLDWMNTIGSEDPWLSIPLLTDPQNPAIAYGTTTHDYVVRPPLWFIDYNLRLIGEDGESIWTNTIHLERDWQPEVCWNGVLPDPVTLLCIKQQDLHPWDPGYCLYHDCP